MLIVDFDRPSSWFLDASKTGESTNSPWVGMVEGTASRKNSKTLTASLSLMFKGRGRFFMPPIIISINNLLP